MQRAVGCVPEERSLCWSGGSVGVRELSGGWHTQAIDENAGTEGLDSFSSSDPWLWYLPLAWITTPSTDRPIRKPAASIETPQPGTCCSFAENLITNLCWYHNRLIDDAFDGVNQVCLTPDSSPREPRFFAAPELVHPRLLWWRSHGYRN